MSRNDDILLPSTNFYEARPRPGNARGMKPITLSHRQIKAADRVGGIELMILWPAELGPEPVMEPDTQDDASDAERACAESLVRDACARSGLVPVRVRIACVRRPKGPPPRPREDEYAAHLAVIIIGRRWVHAHGRPQSRITWPA